MNFLEKIREITDKLSIEGCPGLANEILERQLYSCTGGEVLISVCSKLIEIKHTNKEAYLMIEDKANELISYCKTLGMYPRWLGQD